MCLRIIGLFENDIRHRSERRKEIVPDDFHLLGSQEILTIKRGLQRKGMGGINHV